MPRKKKTPWEPKKTNKYSEPRIYTKISRLFLSRLSQFEKTEIIVYLIIADMTTGEHIECTTISATEIAKRSGIKRDSATKALNNLELKGWIESVGIGKWGAKIYKVTLLENLSDLKPLKSLPQKSDILVKQIESGTFLPTERANFCPLSGQKCT